MGHMKYMWICAALIAVTVGLIAVGADAAAFLPALACAGMMGAMVWMMVRGTGH